MHRPACNMHAVVRAAMATKPKLMLFSHVCNTRSITGAEKLLLHFMREMGSIFDCVLVAPQEGKLAGLARRFDIQVKICSLPMLHGVYTPYQGIANDAEQLRYTPAYQDVVSLIRETSPALVLTNTCVNVLPAIAAKSLQIPVIWKITEIIQINAHTDEAVQMIDRYSDWIIGISETAAAPFKHAGMSGKLSVLPPTWDPALPAPDRWLHLRERKRKELGFRNSHVCIGYISSFIYDAKGLRPFIDMALQLCETHSKARYWIIGAPADKKYYDECVARVKKSGYARRFTFTTFEENVSLAYTAMDMVVIPSMVKEGFGMTALEGIYFAKPVIAFAQGGLSELLEGVGSRQFLAPPGDSNALAVLATTLLNDTELASDMAWRGRAEAERLYGIETYRAGMHTMVTQWLLRYPGWFPYIQAPNGPVYTWGEGGLRTVLALDPGAVRALLFPLSVIQALPLSPLPPIAVGHPVPADVIEKRPASKVRKRKTGVKKRTRKAAQQKRKHLYRAKPTARKRTTSRSRRRARRKGSNTR
ncbi:glycosyltransferase family 4 protein [Paenibacillus illinoisensis]|uniref:glycosyltransferase family 4 protein n=1 Tax=Paenibacillus illinoisensis TaxID=59845 RepID=UPI003D2CB845